MKTKTTPLFAVAAAALLVASPRAAIAGGEGIAAIGGFIGGMIVGSHVGSTHTHTHTTETVVVEHTTVPAAEQPAPEAAEDVRTLPLPVDPPTTTTTTTTTVTRNGVPGYWEDRPVQTWVPARWITTYDRYGFPVRRYEPGHYTTHMERVWVGGVSTVGPAPVIVEPTVVVAPPPYYYGSGYYSSGPAIHVGIGYSHYRNRYPGYYGSHYRPHYPVRPLPSRHYTPHYRSNHVPSHKANYVKGRLNSGSGGLRPKFN